MKYLIRYKLFNEEVEFTPNVNDAPDLKMSKEKLTTILGQIKDYKAKKPLLDQAYLKITDDKELIDKIKSILGPEISAHEDRNPFLVEYLNVSDLKRRLDKVQKDSADDKLKQDDFQEQLKTSATDQKSSIQAKISEISDRINLSNTTISKLKSDIAKAEKSLKDKTDKQEKEMKDYIKNLSDSKSK